MKTWEYKVMHAPTTGGGAFSALKLNREELERLLNQFGADGWPLQEIVSTETNGWTETLHVILKRERSANGS